MVATFTISLFYYHLSRDRRVRAAYLPIDILRILNAGSLENLERAIKLRRSGGVRGGFLIGGESLINDFRYCGVKSVELFVFRSHVGRRRFRWEDGHEPREKRVQTLYNFRLMIRRWRRYARCGTGGRAGAAAGRYLRRRFIGAASFDDERSLRRHASGDSAL